MTADHACRLEEAGNLFEVFEYVTFCHSGLDPESREYLERLDSGFRRNDEGVGFVGFAKVSLQRRVKRQGYTTLPCDFC